jgi:hypothetical protein
LSVFSYQSLDPRELMVLKAFGLIGVASLKPDFRLPASPEHMDVGRIVVIRIDHEAEARLSPYRRHAPIKTEAMGSVNGGVGARL